MRYDKLTLETDAGLGARARIGMLVLKTDQTLEAEAAQVMARVRGVALHHSRIYNDFEINRDTLMAMKPLIAPAAALLPVEWDFKSIGYGCTSGSMTIGEAEVERQVRSVHPRAAVTNPLTGVLTGLAAMNCRRIGVITPYARNVNEGIAEALRARGLEIPAFASFEEPDDNVVGRISVEAISKAAIALGDQDDVDAVFVSCTSMRLVDAVPVIEAATGKPATSSNHAMVWHMLRLAGVDDPIAGLGRLFDHSLSQARAAAE